MSDRSFASGWVNLPVIWVLPSTIATWMFGAETTCVSSTKAACWPWFFVVKSAQILVPSLLKLRFTTHWPRCWS